jgi:hypothetical protein
LSNVEEAENGDSKEDEDEREDEEDGEDGAGVGEKQLVNKDEDEPEGDIQIAWESLEVMFRHNDLSIPCVEFLQYISRLLDQSSPRQVKTQKRTDCYFLM